MVRRNRDNPQFLVTAYDTEKQRSLETRGGGITEGFYEESEHHGEEAPSKYNLFHSNTEGVRDAEWYMYVCSQSPSSRADSKLDEMILPTRPVSSVQIAEVKFSDSFSRESLSLKQRQSGAGKISTESQDEGKGAVKGRRQLMREGKREKECPARKSKHQKGKATPRHENATSSERLLPNPIRNRSDASRKSTTPNTRSFTESVQQAWREHAAAPTPSAHARGHQLSQFFLSGVESGTTEEEGDLEEAVLEKRREVTSSGKISRSILPVSATIWLPGNSVLAGEAEENPNQTSITPSDPDSTEQSTSCTAALAAEDTHIISNRRPNPLLSGPQVPSSTFDSPPSPQHSCSSPRDTAPQHSNRNPLLGTSVYHLETDLPPPTRSRAANSFSQTCFSSVPVTQHQTLSTTSSAAVVVDSKEGGTLCNASRYPDGESDTEEDEMFGFCDDDDELARFSGEKASEEGVDSEALEDLAWELQSMTGGRLTRCEGEWEEGEGEEEEEGEGEGEEEGGGEGEEGEHDMEELEAGIERVMTSFELHQKQLMQQDSD